MGHHILSVVVDLIFGGLLMTCDAPVDSAEGTLLWGDEEGSFVDVSGAEVRWQFGADQNVGDPWDATNAEIVFADSAPLLPPLTGVVGA